ncbi:hypothetical protein K5D56_07550 [Pseudomonas cichorii]|nr:hypothetical protein [Pseudomonas lijiangensis]MBX8518919.1 hypothetical protein [Pseudomonas cichorii]MBX8538908.1 hypothetical protein [Pseudomonas cichorii]MBX8544219.1 hypothetical protein [Pseudomonas cichorii]MBX8559521.1 hypothetical protein [Pseudomonas cichorii]
MIIIVHPLRANALQRLSWDCLLFEMKYFELDSRIPVRSFSPDKWASKQVNDLHAAIQKIDAAPLTYQAIR